MRLTNEKVVVCGAGGFIGGHLLTRLLHDGVDVIRAVDIKPLNEWYQLGAAIDNIQADLKDMRERESALDGATAVFNLAADMGGMGESKTTKRSVC